MSIGNCGPLKINNRHIIHFMIRLIMKKILILCSLLLAPVALFFISSSSNNLSELGAQNVEALSWGDNNNEVPPYPNMALLPIDPQEETIVDVTVAGEADLLPTLKVSDSRLEINCQYSIVYTGFKCFSENEGCLCPPGAQKITIVGLTFKKRNEKPNM